MVQAGLPAAGSQIRRKSDGILGEVYAADPPAKLSIRWASIAPGAYAREDCTLEQFDKAWELTGVRVKPPRETRIALALIGLAVLLFFTFVLVHDTTAYTGYDPFKPLADDTPSVLNSAQQLNAKYGIQAAQACAIGADEYIRSITHHRFHWDTSDLLTPRFDRFSPTVSTPGVLTMISDRARVSNGFGVFHPVAIGCNYDTQSREVLSYEGQDEGQ